MTHKIEQTLNKIEGLKEKVNEAIVKASEDCLDDVIKIVFTHIHERPLASTFQYVELLENLKLDVFLQYDCESYRTFINNDKVDGFAFAKGWKTPKRIEQDEDEK